MGNGIITAEDLALRLVNAKKVMNKVDTGNFEKGQIDEEILFSDPENLMGKPMMTENKIKPPVTPTADRINNTKLPDNIKRAMIERPITQPELSLNETMDIKLAQRSRQLMEQDGSISPKNQTTRQPQKQQQTVQTSNVNINEVVTQMLPLIENMLRKILDEKLTQILTAQDTSSINENLVLKVGDSIFKGKITGVKSAK